MAEWVGFLACLVSVLCFGSSFVPVKKFNAGDGVFFQWVMCASIWMCGVLVNLIRDAPQFEPLAMVGGMLWATGNTLCVPVIHFIGIGLGMLIWGGSNLIVGWASGRFGFFGIKKQTDIALPALNYVGVFICMASLAIFFFVKPSVSKVNHRPLDTTDQDAENDVERGHTVQKLIRPSASGSPSTPEQRGNGVDSGYVAHQEALEFPGHHAQIDPHNHSPRSDSPRTPTGGASEPSDFGALDNLTPFQKQMCGCGGGVLAGLFFGLNFVPPQYLIDHPHSSTSSCDAIILLLCHGCCCVAICVSTAILSVVASCNVV